MTSIAAVSASGSSGGSSVASQITALHKQEAALNQKLRDVATSTADEKTKKSQTDLINSQIQVLQLQISRLEQQQTADRTQKVEASAKVSETAKATHADKNERADKAAQVARARNQRSLDGAGNALDTSL